MDKRMEGEMDRQTMDKWRNRKVDNGQVAGGTDRQMDNG